MKIGLLSDIHANQLALEAVLFDAEARGVERCWFLGDAVGYGPDPHVPLLWLKHMVDPQDWVLGNHDAMMAGLMPLDNVSPSAHISDDKNRLALSAPEHAEADRFWRENFTPERCAPHLHTLDGCDYLLVHSSQVDHLGQQRYTYAWQVEIFLPQEFGLLRAQAQAAGQPRCLVYGHTHVPALVQACPLEEGEFEFRVPRILPGVTYPLECDLALINPGSVGQPRDLNTRTGYAILDTADRTVTFYRLPYNWQETARRLVVQEYPESLRDRLMVADASHETPPDWIKHYREVSAQS